MSDSLCSTLKSSLLTNDSLVAIQAGGYTYHWTNQRVLTPLIIGILLIIAFLIWSWKFAQRPLIPREIFQGQRHVGMSFFAAFVCGIDFYSLINFFPLTFKTVFTPKPVLIGLRGLGYGISVTAGAAFFNFMLTVFKHNNREVLIVSAVIMSKSHLQPIATSAHFNTLANLPSFTAAFGGALAAVAPETPGLSVAMGTLCGFGVGGLLVPTQTIAITCRYVASSFLNQSQSSIKITR